VEKGLVAVWYDADNKQPFWPTWTEGASPRQLEHRTSSISKTQEGGDVGSLC
jgi:hypothetical protein